MSAPFNSRTHEKLSIIFSDDFSETALVFQTDKGEVGVGMPNETFLASVSDLCEAVLELEARKQATTGHATVSGLKLLDAEVGGHPLPQLLGLRLRLENGAVPNFLLEPDKARALAVALMEMADRLQQTGPKQ